MAQDYAAAGHSVLADLVTRWDIYTYLHISTHIYISTYLHIYPPVRGSLDDAPRHDGAPLVRGGPGDAAAGRVDLQTLHSTVTSHHLHPPLEPYSTVSSQPSGVPTSLL